MSTKVQEWVEEIDTLTLIAQSQPHATFAGLTHDLISKWNYLQRAIPDTGEHFQPLEDAIRLNFLPILTGKPAHHKGFGVTGLTKPSLMSVCSTLLCPAIAGLLLLRHTDVMDYSGLVPCNISCTLKLLYCNKIYIVFLFLDTCHETYCSNLFERCKSKKVKYTSYLSSLTNSNKEVLNNDPCLGP